MNEIIRNLTIENYLNLKAAFANSKKIFWSEEKSKLIHPGEYGSYREELLKRWLRMYIPKNYDISSGFIINHEGLISHQCDIVIYNKNITPHIETIDKQTFFPVETVIAVGEVKSDINSSRELNDYLIKMSSIKRMRLSVEPPRIYQSVFGGEFDIAANPYFNVFTFLICNKFNFRFDVNEINYNGIERIFQHNMILSLEDGLSSYVTKEGTPNLEIPFMPDKELNYYYSASDKKDLPSHIILFLVNLNRAMFFTTQLEIDMTFYLTDKITHNII